MDTTTLKKFAQGARRQLIEQVSARMEQVLRVDSVEVREKAKVVEHMIAFERAEAESPLPLIEQVEWDAVKEWFRGQAKSIGKSWLG
jgi:hypothetical protein